MGVEQIKSAPDFCAKSLSPKKNPDEPTGSPGFPVFKRLAFFCIGGGAGGSRTRVRTKRRNAFYMLIR